jgi:catechol 2,3-dioxygenase-like lactoylglutathione lyase family enzyme
MPTYALHHVQLAIPQGGEPEARAFFGDLLGMEEVAKPPALAARGGCWFASGGLELHLGVEDPFHPASKAHPGILVDDLDDVVARLGTAGYDATPDELFPGFRRAYTADPFGNRLEFLQPSDDGQAPFDGSRARAQARARARGRA